MPLQRQNAIEGDEGGDAISDAFQRIQEALRGREQNVQEDLRRLRETAAAALQAALGQVEQKMQQRDEAIRALERRLEARLLTLEGRMTAAEERLAPFTERGGNGTRSEDGKSFEQLEHRMQNLEASIQRALVSVFPRVESLVEKLEKSSPGATGTPSAAPAAPSLSRSPCSLSAASDTVQSSALAETWVGARERHNRSPRAEADEDEEREKQVMMARMQELKSRRIRARMSPALLGEKLCQAAFMGRLEDVRRLTNTETFVNYIDKEGDSPLISALLSKSPNARVVSLLLERGADVNAINDQGRTAIHYAAAYDIKGRSVRLLIGAGADVDARDVTGATPLHWAAFNGNETAVRALLAVGAKSYLRGWSDEWTGKTPFDVATSDGVRMLLRQ